MKKIFRGKSIGGERGTPLTYKIRKVVFDVAPYNMCAISLVLCGCELISDKHALESAAVPRRVRVIDILARVGKTYKYKYRNKYKYRSGFGRQEWGKS